MGRALVDPRAGTLGRGVCPELPALMNPNLKVSVGKAPLVQSEATELLRFAFLFLLNAFSGKKKKKNSCIVQEARARAVHPKTKTTALF